MDAEETRKISVANPERISRILRKVSDSKLWILLRQPSLGKKAVKGRVQGILEEGEAPSVLISDISEAGMTYLQAATTVWVDLVLASVRVRFEATINERIRQTIKLDFPRKVLSYDRRKDERIGIDGSSKAFLKLNAWQPKKDLLAPPSLSLFPEFGKWISIKDISFGGVCVTSPFPAYAENLRVGDTDGDALIMLPFQKAHKVELKLVWTSVEDVPLGVEQGQKQYKRNYLFGWKFVELSEDSRSAIRKFMQKLYVADSI